VTIKKRSLIPREVDDFYRTPYWCTDALCRVEQFDGGVWEPACGDGEISEVLRWYGYEVTSSDLISRGYGWTADFLAFRNLQIPPQHPNVVTNPPYRLAEDFVHAALAMRSPKVAMFLRLAWLEGGRRKASIFDRTPPSRVWVMSNRPTLWTGSGGSDKTTGGAIPYAWFVWDRKHVGPTTVGWLSRSPNLALATLSLGRALDRMTRELHGFCA
jgi:hypothetical protein